MGGYGSGRWHHASKRPVAEQSLPLRIGQFRRAISEVPAPGDLSSGTLTWSQNRQPIATVQYSIANDGGALCLILSYRLRNGRAVQELFNLDYTTPGYGGRRWWFVCRKCNRPCGVLFNVDGFWRCRGCHRVTYQSSNESDSRSARLLAGGLDTLQSADLLTLMRALKRLK